MRTNLAVSHYWPFAHWWERAGNGFQKIVCKNLTVGICALVAHWFRTTARFAHWLRTGFALKLMDSVHENLLMDPVHDNMLMDPVP